MMWPINFRWFSRNKALPSTPVEVGALTPAYIEALIERAGRDAVFNKVQANGWPPGSAPPLWVWNVACQEVLAERMGKA